MKLKGWHIAVIAIFLFAYLGGYITINYQANITPPGDNDYIPDPNLGTVSVNKQVKLVFVDKYAGSAPPGTTSNGVTIYDSDGVTQLEQGTISSGTVTTANSYPSGYKLYVRYFYDSSPDEYQWWEVTVPKMTSADAESLTTNPVRLWAHDLPVLTDALRDGAGNTYADAGNWNVTTGATPGTTSGTLSYSWFVASDNDGYISSYDPVYKINLKAVVYCAVTGTNYETVILNGFDGAFEKGTTMYYYKVLSDTDLTKYKVGQNYVYPGTGTVTFSIDLTGYSGDSATLQLYVYAYSDPNYFKTYTSYGPYAAQLAESTLLLYD